MHCFHFYKINIWKKLQKWTSKKTVWRWFAWTVFQKTYDLKIRDTVLDLVDIIKASKIKTFLMKNLNKYNFTDNSPPPGLKR